MQNLFRATRIAQAAIVTIAFAIFLAFAAPQSHANDPATGLKITDTQAGTGETAQRHGKVTVHYTGWLTDGTKFDSSLDRGQPFSFTLGLGQVIRGWDMGVTGMRVGGTRVLEIPPHLGYGARGAGQAIPPNAPLKFEVRLLAVEPPKYTNLDPAALDGLIKQGGITLVDIRRPDEWAETGTIAGAHKLTAFDKDGKFNRAFPPAFEKLVKRGDPVALICRAGNRSAILAHALTEQAGFTKVHHLEQGIESWIEAGKPVTR